jgi:HAD superfamily hydrolase (TIGR01509 family)
MAQGAFATSPVVDNNHCRVFYRGNQDTACPDSGSTSGVTMPIQAVIFDMDGVLVDSEEYWWQARVAFAEQLGKVWSFDDQRTAMGRNTVEWARVMQERLQIDMPLEEIIERVRASVIAYLEQRLPVLPGALESVQKAASAYRVALASGSPKLVIDTIMRLTELDEVFEHIVYADDMPHGKPAPDVYFETARRLGLAPVECIGIEDSGNGLRALHAAGMYVIAVPSPGFPLADELLALADRTLPSLEAFSVELVREIEAAR